MKHLLIFFLFLAASGNAQDLREQIKQINTVEAAMQFLTDNPGSDAQIVTYTPGLDIDPAQNPFPGNSIDNVAESGFMLKKVGSKMVTASRVRYIFLDGAALPQKKINKLRSKILKEIKNGTPFQALAKAYSMDGNKEKGGDLDWFIHGQMVPEFERMVKSHLVNDVFTIDLPEQNWYYIVLKTHDEKEVEEVTFLKVRTR